MAAVCAAGPLPIITTLRISHSFGDVEVELIMEMLNGMIVGLIRERIRLARAIKLKRTGMTGRFFRVGVQKLMYKNESVKIHILCI